MKKVLATGVALLMAGGIATAAEMDDQSGVKITGNARARAIVKDSYSFGNNPDEDTQLNFDSRVRMEIRGTAAGGSYIHARIRMMEDKFGSEGADTSLNVYVDKAYIGVPFNDAFTLEAGKYRQSYGYGFMYDDIALAGARGVYETAGGLRIIPFFEVNDEAQDSDVVQDKNEDNDAYRIGAAVATFGLENWVIGATAAFDTDDRVDGETDGFWGNVYADGTMGAFGLRADFAYAENGVVIDGETKSGQGDDDGWGGYIRGSWNMDALTLAVDLGITVDGFLPDAAYGFVMIGGEEPIRAVRVGGGAQDVYWAGLRASYAVSEALSLTGNLVYADADLNETEATPDVRGVYDAVEISGVLQYAVSKGTTFSWYAGYLAPSFDGRANAAGLEEDGAFGTYAKFDVSF
jgi:hypothetical protein